MSEKMIQHCERLLKQNFTIYHDYVKQQEVLRLEFLGTSTDYKYLRTWLDIAYEDILTSKSKHGTLTQHYEVLLKNNIVLKFLDYANDHEALQLKFIETIHQCNDIKTNLDASNEYIKSLKSDYNDSCQHGNGGLKSSKTLRLKLVESINECERIKKSLDAVYENIIMLNSEHDGLTRRFRVLFRENMIKEFLEYAKYQEKLELKFMEETNENECSKSCLDQANKEITSLNSKLTEIRETLNRERLLSEKIYKQRDSLDYLSEELCCLLLKYQRRAASNDMKEQCSIIDEAVLKSANIDCPSKSSNRTIEFDSSCIPEISISEMKIEKKEIECDNFDENKNEQTMMKKENPDVNHVVSTELEVPFSDEDDNTNLSKCNKSSSEKSPNSKKSRDTPPLDEILNHSESSEPSVLESLDEHSYNRISDVEDEMMPTSNTNEVVPDTVANLRIKQPVSNLRCDVFCRDFPSMFELKEHNCIACERLKLFKCSDCGQMFAREDALQHHTSQIHDFVKNYYDCAHCQKRFVSKRGLISHIYTKHSEKYDKPYKCTICDASFTVEFLLTRHKDQKHNSVETSALDHSESPEPEPIQKSHVFQTSILESPDEHSYNRISDVQDETILTSNTNEIVPNSVTNLGTKQLVSNLRCDIFCRDYPSMCELNEHNCIACERLKLFKCKDCGQMFAREDALQHHTSQVHELVANYYDCAHCQKRYVSMKGFKYHMYTKHSEKYDKPYKCTICDASFAVNFLLTMHKDQKHNAGETSDLYCDICDQIFLKKISLRNHKARAHRKKRFACTKCDKMFKTKSALKVHSFAHNSEKTFECSTCGQRFKTYSSRSCHEKSVHSCNAVLFFCAHCDKHYYRKSKLSIHLHEQHFGRKKKSKSYKCATCDKSFSEKNYLKVHLSTHSSEKPFKCSICNVGFRHKGNKTQHEQRVHRRELRLCCAHCDKRYVDKHSLKNHIHKHHFSGLIKPFKCTICDGAFTASSYLKHHIKVVHFSNRIVKCSFCDKYFKHDQNKRQHERSAHPPAISFYCSHCGKRYNNEKALKIHVQHFHASEPTMKPFECPICNKTFASEITLEKHKSTHSERNDARFNCAHCDKVYHRKIAIARHMQEIHLPRVKKLFKCPICRKAFPAKRHLDEHQVVHITERSYKCSTCDKCFKNHRSKRHHEIRSHERADLICAYCDKKFRDKPSICRHIQVNHLSRNKRFKCNVCKKSFPFADYLRTHQRVHSSRKSYKCSKCDKCYSTPEGKRKHERIVHEGHRFKCRRCDNKYSSKQRLLIHVQNNHS